MSLAVVGPDAPRVFFAGFELHFGSPFGLLLALPDRLTAFFFAGGVFDLKEVFSVGIDRRDVAGDELHRAGLSLRAVGWQIGGRKVPHRTHMLRTLVGANAGEAKGDG